MKAPTRWIAAALGILLGLNATAQETNSPKKPVKIFLLSGQSNMTGRGSQGSLTQPAADQKATLVRFIKEPENIEKYKFLYEGKSKDAGGWTIRDDVYISYGAWPHDPNNRSAKHGGLAPGYGGVRQTTFGPELGIGHVLGDHYEEPVLLVKIAFGATSLVDNFGPPSAQADGKPGKLYPQVVRCVEDSIAHLAEIIPGYDPSAGYEIFGFFWNQGEHDMSEGRAEKYEHNLACLINDLRKDLKAPAIKAVIATTGFGGWEGKSSKDPIASKVIAAQLAVAKRPEFKGAVATTETRDFWRPAEQFGGVASEGIHWNHNGESVWLVGEAMGRDMVKLLKSN